MGRLRRGLPWGAIARADAVSGVVDLRSGLPSGVTLTRGGSGTYFNTSGVLQSAGSNTARFGYEPLRPELGPALLLEPASKNWVKNSTWVGAVRASGSGNFATGTNTTPGNWGTLPGNCSYVVPALTDGSTSGLQIVGTGTWDGAPYIDVRMKLTNLQTPAEIAANSSYIQRFLFTPGSGTGIPAARGDTWTVSARVKLIAGSFGQGGNTRISLRGLIGTVRTVIHEEGLPLTDVGDEAFVAFTQTFGEPISAMTAGISSVTRAQTTNDVTLRIAVPRLEMQAGATSPIPTNNTVFVERPADVLHFATGAGPGSYTVRMIGRWESYPVTITSSDGVLDIPCPPRAIGAGAFQFTGFTWSTAALPADARRLRHAMPARKGIAWHVSVPPAGGNLPTATETNPITGRPYGTDPADRFYDKSLEVVFEMPTTQAVYGNVKALGGASQTFIGGAFAPSNAAGALNSALRFAFTSAGCARWIWIEGVAVDTAATTLALDAFRVSGILEVPVAPRQLFTPDVYVQNCRVDNLHGTKTPNTDHADIFQATAPMGWLYIDKLSGRCNYQGLFVPNVNPVLMLDYTKGTYPVPIAALPKMFVKGRSYSRINMGYVGWPAANSAFDNGAYFWFANSPNDTDRRWPGRDIGDRYPAPTSLHQCWTSAKPTKPWQDTFYPNVDRMVFPNPAQDTPKWHAIYGDDAITAHYHPDQKVRGCVRQGPPSDDFVAATACGIGYQTPGFGWVA